ncbi:LuxR C-terminal-related transcriptional regulator [Micromonospora chaiyaphumensis]|uniref:Regulatory protein, luxR family n=1 Tax=Micromonospora chaiyaphumensis TaxID=307119 RepID=A0A1C4UTE1_9ACTN|nr:LuxR C-terminal-related transcriptional regulator [Micromonospora chaiyaphumensis]SCE74973.1 regulatory protein, luxR family [Micromonospora chaiyaphumensis]
MAPPLAATAPQAHPASPNHVAPSLTRYGFTPSADLVFRSLTAYGPQTGGRLARDLGMPVTVVLGCLAELRDGGLVCEPAGPRGSSGTWRAVPLARAMAAVAHRRRPGADASRRPSAHAMELSNALVELGGGVNHLTTRDAARRRLAALVGMARREHLAMNPESTFDESAKTAAGSMDRMLRDRGVAVRMIGVQPRDVDLLVPYGGVDAGGSGASYRESPGVPLKLIVVDRAVALFPVDPGNYERGYLEIHHAPVVESLVATFERHWQSSAPSAATGLFLTDREAALVNLLARGHTEARAARELRISERSVSGALRALMDRLKVHNRFQLGLLLGSAGVFGPPPRHDRPPAG